MSSQVEISVVIPVYNNEQSLSELASRLVTTFSILDKSYEIIFIDDGSRDNSINVLNLIATNNNNIKVIQLSKNYGQHPAICAGFEHARGNYVVLMDADLQDLPEHVVDLYKKITGEALDIVYTIKISEQKNNVRFTSLLYHYVFSKMVNAKVPKNVGTLRIFNRHFLMGILQFKEVNVLYGPLMFYMGFKSDYLELSYKERQHGRSSYTFIKRLKLATNSLLSYTDIPHKVAIFLGTFIFIASTLYCLLVLLQYALVGSSLPNGSTLILLVLFFTLGSVMIMLGIIGSYIFRVYQEVLHRPRYLIRDKINLP